MKLVNRALLKQGSVKAETQLNANAEPSTTAEPRVSQYRKRSSLRGHVFVLFCFLVTHHAVNASENSKDNGIKKQQFLTVPVQEYPSRSSKNGNESSALCPSSESPNPTPKSVSVSNSVVGGSRACGFNFTPAEIAGLARRLPSDQSPRKTIRDLADPQEPSRTVSPTDVVAGETTVAPTADKNDAADKLGICSALCCFYCFGVRVPN